MVKQADVYKVRKEIIRHVGSRVKIRANKGRNRMDITEGIISETYPSIFLITIDNKEQSDAVKTLSFSYTDILTKDVQMMLCQE